VPSQSSIRILARRESDALNIN